MRSPTEKTLKHLRRSGYVAAVTEVWIQHQWAKPRPDGSIPGNRRDLFGYVDVLAVGNGETIAAQCCAVSGISGHYRKILGQESVPGRANEKEAKRIVAANYDRRLAVKECLAAGWTIAIYAWDDDKHKKIPKIRYIDATDLVDQDALAL